MTPLPTDTAPPTGLVWNYTTLVARPAPASPNNMPCFTVPNIITKSYFNKVVSLLVFSELTEKLAVSRLRKTLSEEARKKRE